MCTDSQVHRDAGWSEKARAALVRWVISRGVPPEAAEDAAQAAVAAVLAPRYAGLPEDERRAVAFGVARRWVAQWYRERAAGQRGERPEAGIDPLSGLAAAEERQRVYRLALETLDPIDMRIIAARLLDGRAFALIAAEHGLTEAAARQRFVRAIQSVRTAMGGAGPT